MCVRVCWRACCLLFSILVCGVVDRDPKESVACVDECPSKESHELNQMVPHDGILFPQ